MTSRSLRRAGFLTAAVLVAVAHAARAGTADPEPARRAAPQAPAAAASDSRAPNKVSPYAAANRRRARDAANARGARRGHGHAPLHLPSNPARHPQRPAHGG